MNKVQRQAVAAGLIFGVVCGGVVVLVVAVATHVLLPIFTTVLFIALVVYWLDKWANRDDTPEVHR